MTSDGGGEDDCKNGDDKLEFQFGDDEPHRAAGGDAKFDVVAADSKYPTLFRLAKRCCCVGGFLQLCDDDAPTTSEAERDKTEVELRSRLLRDFTPFIAAGTQ